VIGVTAGPDALSAENEVHEKTLSSAHSPSAMDGALP